MSNLPSISTEQLESFVTLSEVGSIRKAAKILHVTEQGLRNRMLVLEQRLGLELYTRTPGRRETHLTQRALQLLPHAREVLAQTRCLGDAAAFEASPTEIHIASSQYLAYYVLVDAIARFHASEPDTRIRLSTRSEREIQKLLHEGSPVELAIAASFEADPDIEFQHLFSLDWFVITPMGHAFDERRSVGLSELADQPLILFESDSAGRQHILQGFQRENLTPCIALEATNTQTILRMVEEGLGVSIVPLFEDGCITRGTRVRAYALDDLIRPIRTGVLTRRGRAMSTHARRFIEFVRKGVSGAELRLADDAHSANGQGPN